MYATTKMTKIDVSAAMRQNMPTRPRVGSSHFSSPAVIVIGAAFMDGAPLLVVLPIWILRVLEVPERPAASHDRNRREVVGSRRGAGGPFQRPCVPWIVPGRLGARGGPP